MAGRDDSGPRWKGRIARFYPRRRVVDFVLLISARYCALFFVSIPLCAVAFVATDMDGHDRHAEPVRSFLYQSLRMRLGIGSYAFALCFCIGAIAFLGIQRTPGRAASIPLGGPLPGALR